MVALISKETPDKKICILQAGAALARTKVALISAWNGRFKQAKEDGQACDGQGRGLAGLGPFRLEDWFQRYCTEAEGVYDAPFFPPSIVPQGECMCWHFEDKLCNAVFKAQVEAINAQYAADAAAAKKIHDDAVKACGDGPGGLQINTFEIEQSLRPRTQGMQQRMQQRIQQRTAQIIQLNNPNNDIFTRGGTPVLLSRNCAKEKTEAIELLNLYRETETETITDLFDYDKEQANKRFQEKLTACTLADIAWRPFNFWPFFVLSDCITTAQINHDLWVRLWEIRKDERLNALNTEIIARLLAIQKNYVQCCASLAGMGSCSRNSTHSPQY